MKAAADSNAFIHFCGGLNIWKRNLSQGEFGPESGCRVRFEIRM